MKWFFLALGILAIITGGLDLLTGESTLSSGRHGSRTSRTLTPEEHGQEYYGFVVIKFFAGTCLIGLYRFMNKDEDTWY